MATEIKVNNKTVYITATGFKVGSKGKVTPPKDFLQTFPKGDRRKIRKTARKNGFAHHAAQ